MEQPALEYGLNCHRDLIATSLPSLAAPNSPALFYIQLCGEKAYYMGDVFSE